MALPHDYTLTHEDTEVLVIACERFERDHLSDEEYAEARFLNRALDVALTSESALNLTPGQGERLARACRSAVASVVEGKHGEVLTQAAASRLEALAGLFESRRT